MKGYDGESNIKGQPFLLVDAGIGHIHLCGVNEGQNATMAALAKTVLPEEVIETRAKFLGGLATVSVFAEAIRKSPRTVQRMIAAGMIPVVRVGETQYVDVDRARAEREERRGNPK